MLLIHTSSCSGLGTKFNLGKIYNTHYSFIFIISPKFENFGDIMFLVGPPPSPSSLSPPHTNTYTNHNFVKNTPIKFIFAIAIEVPDYKNPMIFGINRKNQMASGGHFV